MDERRRNENESKNDRNFSVCASSGSILITPAAQPNKPLKCEFEMDVFWTTPPHRERTVTGDIEGTLTVTELPATLPGKTEHFLEYSRL